MSADLREVESTWERLAQVDPLWAVLSDPAKQGGRWDAQEFLATGEAEIAALMRDLRGHGFSQSGHALDFGCGAGRLSIALSSRFQNVTSIDISPTMIETARRFADGRQNIRFILNNRDDLSVIESASLDLVYSNIVLQHMPPEAAESYIREFYRIVRPGGFVVFQIPSHLTEEWLPSSNDGTRLPAEACHAEIRVIDAPSSLVAGAQATVRVQIRNASPVDWTQDLTNQINLGNHWLSQDGVEIQHDDARSRLPGRVGAGESCEVPIDVRAPVAEGTLLLDFDVVQEGICWFADRGSLPGRCAVLVTPPVGAQASSIDKAEYPTFMMHGIPVDDVDRLVAECGAAVLAADEHVTEWVSYRYITRKA